MIRPALAVLVSIAVFGSIGCSGESESKLLASARTYLDQRDNKSAIIQLKNVLQKNPSSAPARQLLGRALLDSGDPRAAVVEFGKALELGAPEDECLPDMARALLLTGEPAKVSAQYAGKQLRDPKAAADLYTSVASAFAQQPDPAKALEYTQRALQSSPGFPAALVLQAQLKAAQRDFDGALALVDEVLKKDKTDFGAGALRATLLWQGKGDREAAAAAFREVLAAHPRAVMARTSLIAILREQGKVDDSTRELAELKKVAPNHPDTAYLEARSAYQAGDFRTAQELAERVLKVLPDSVPALEIGGAAAYRGRAYAQAEAYLARAVQRAPTRPLPRQLLAQTYLRTGQPTRAIETLQPLVSRPDADGPSLAMAGEAYLQAGDPQKSDEAFRRAAKASPDNTDVRTSVAIALATRGRVTEALPELENLAASGNNPRPDLALISARMSQKDYPGALKAIDAVEKKLPAGALPDFLRGRVALARDDRAGARRAFESALAKDGQYFPAVSALSALDLAAGQPQQARQRYEALLKANPKSHLAHLALAEIAQRSGADVAETKRHLTDAVQVAPTEIEPRVQLVNLLLRAGDAKGALSAAQDASTALPDIGEIQDVLGRAQLAAGDGQQAVLTFRKLAAAQPSNAQLQVRVAEAQYALKDKDGARASLKKALELDPKLFAAQRALATIAMTEQKPDEAVAIARGVQQASPQDAAGFALEGEIQAARKEWPAAVAALRAAVSRKATPELAVALHSALLNAGQRGDADRWAADWERGHPKDLAFRYHLGDVALTRGDWAVAETHYRTVLEWQPQNALAMNNLAWLLVRQGKPGATALAERATQLLPDRPVILDTLAGALAADKQFPRAIEVQKQALQRSPQEPALRLNLARIYLAAGDKAQARTELQALAALGAAFKGQGEVSELLKATQ